ncbi:MAG: hypothetical protein AAGE59_13545 [Cyanobacteria bacterium P01_F01_bin.86]
MDAVQARKIAAEMPVFQAIEQKADFLFVLGALQTRLISLKKAAEVMNMEVDAFLQILDLIGVDFSYLTEEDVALEKTW